jgi:hypothetical protein
VSADRLPPQPRSRGIDPIVQAGLEALCAILRRREPGFDFRPVVKQVVPRAIRNAAER